MILFVFFEEKWPWVWVNWTVSICISCGTTKRLFHKRFDEVRHYAEKFHQSEGFAIAALMPDKNSSLGCTCCNCKINLSYERLKTGQFKQSTYCM